MIVNTVKYLKVLKFMRIKKISANLEKMVAILKISKFQVANYLFLCQLYRSTIVRNFMLVSQFALSSQKIEFVRPTNSDFNNVIPGCIDILALPNQSYCPTTFTPICIIGYHWCLLVLTTLTLALYT